MNGVMRLDARPAVAAGVVRKHWKNARIGAMVRPRPPRAAVLLVFRTVRRVAWNATGLPPGPA